MPTSTTVKGLNINELTEAQYDAAVQGGVIGPNELSVLTDVSYVEPSDLATVATTGDYDDLINKPTIPAALPDQTGHSGEFLTTDGTDASWGDALVNVATGTSSLSVGKASTANNAVTVVSPDSSTITTASGSVAVGSGAFSQATAGIAIGQNSTVYSSNGQYGISIGQSAATRGMRAINIGHGAGGNGGNGNYGIAIGSEAQAKQNYSIQLGSGSNNEAGTFCVASYYNSANVNYKLMDADGTIPTARFTTDPSADGTYYPTLTISSGTPTRSWSTISALQNLATGAGSLGLLSATTATSAVLIGDNASITYGAQQVVVGSGATATGNRGTAVGLQTAAYGNDSTAIGAYSQATTSGVAIGRGAKTTAANAIQISSNGSASTNADANTMKVANVNGNYELMSADGTIPTARLTKVNSTITLTAAGWSGGSQTVTVNGVTSTSVVFVAPDPADTTDYVSAGILCTSQTTNSLTFTATTTPTSDIDVNIVCL